MGESPDSFKFRLRVPDGDDRERMVCDDCGWIHYVNPKIVVGAVCAFEDKLLICRRAIEPRVGFWTMPAGYLELHETTEDGAIREAREEAGVDIELDGLLGVYSLPRIAQVHMIYRARMKSAAMAPGPESLETRLVRPEELPWDEMAFLTVEWSFRDYERVRGETTFAPFTTPADYLARPR